MAGFGKSLLVAIAGAAEGYGDYLQMEGKQRIVQEQEERQSQRAMALEEFRAKMQGDRDERLNENRRGEIVLTGLVNRENNKVELQTKGALDAESDKRDFANYVKKKAVDFADFKKRTGIELTNAQKLEAFKAEKTAEVKAKEEGLKPVGDDIDEATGTRVLYYRDQQGNTRVYDTGTVVQSKSSTNPLTGDVTRETSKPTKKAMAGWRDEPAASGGTGATERSKVDIGIDQLLTSYGTATPERYPGLFRNGKKIPIEEAKAMIRRAVGS